MAKVSFTAGRVSAFKCPPDKAQAFMWDSSVEGLGLRATPNGKPAFVFQGVYQGKTLRMTIGRPDAWSIKEAQSKARELQRLIDEGKDPRNVKRETLVAQARKSFEEQANALTVGDTWQLYLDNGRPKRKDAWKDGYKADLIAMASAGGKEKKRGNGLTRSGPIYPLLSHRLVDITEDSLKLWYDQEAKRSKHQAARALMMFRGFLRWCSAQPKLRQLVVQNYHVTSSVVLNSFY